MKKIVLGLLTIGLTSIFLFENNYYAAENNLRNSPSSEVSANSENNSRTLTVAAKGHLTGMVTPYIKGIPNLGKVTLHYVGNGLGFSDFDSTTLFIKLPDEFKYVASQEGFRNVITGKITVPGSRYTLSNDDIQVFSDRIVIKLGRRFYLGVGTYRADIEINYGKLINDNPKIPINDSKGGYIFSSNLVFDVAPWDIINFPIVGEFSGDWVSSERQAIK
ncbi:TPA: hypothetical protein ACIZC1_002788 [Enterococcus faecalis]